LELFFFFCNFGSTQGLNSEPCVWLEGTLWLEPCSHPFGFKYLNRVLHLCSGWPRVRYSYLLFPCSRDCCQHWYNLWSEDFHFQILCPT
jgi:hypothetical protein